MASYSTSHSGSRACALISPLSLSLAACHLYHSETNGTFVCHSGYDSCKGDFDYWFVKPYCKPDCYGKEYDHKKEQEHQKEYKPQHDEKKK